MNKLTAGIESKGAQAIYNILNQPRITDVDRGILASVFEGRDEVYLALRNLFYGFDLDDNEKKLIKSSFASEQVRKVVRKIFLPELQKDIPIGQNTDLWITSDVSTATLETFDLVYKVKETMIDMVEKSLARLEDIELEAVDLSVKKDLAFLTARNSYSQYIDKQLRTIAANATKPETPEEAMTRLKKDSLK